MARTLMARLLITVSNSFLGFLEKNPIVAILG